MRLKLTWSILVTMACLFGAANLAAKSSAVDDGFYTTQDKEYYLTPEQLLFIRPGLEAEILDVVLPPDMQLEVTFSITDPAGLPLDNTGVTTPGPVDFRFTLANIPMGEEQKVRLAYERDSRNGTLTTVGEGVYKYKFDYVMDSDQDTTHTLVLGFRRDLREFELDRYAANDIYSWVPSGMYDAVPRDVVTADTCNRCHDPLAMHGSRWLSPAACNQCHNATGNTRFEALVHAVHAAKEIERADGSRTYDFSEITYPAPLNACETCHVGGTPTENFPMVATPAAALVCDYSGLGSTTLTWEHSGYVDIYVANATQGAQLLAIGEPTGSLETGKWVRDGTVFTIYDRATNDLLQEVTVNATVFGCVSNAPGAPRGTPGAQHTNWMDHPSRAVCGSCHTDIDFEAGVGHAVQTTDGSCYFCHEPTGVEFGPSVAGAHQVAKESAKLSGIIIELLGITDTDPGDTPTVSFKVGSKYGPVNPANLDRVRAYIYGPNSDVNMYIRDTVGGNAVPADEAGVWNYTFGSPLPMDATGSYTVSFEAYNDIELEMGDKTDEVTDSVEQTILTFAVTDSPAKPRREIVKDENCEACHVNLHGHHGRTNAQFCVSCHNPTLVDIADVPESVNMKWMIHKIHRGAELENGYTVIRSRGTYVFDEILYPGDLRNCEACHINNSQQVPTSDSLLPQITPNFWWDPIEPAASACLGCHDSDSASAHAYANTTFFGESCATCHGDGKAESVDKVHAR
jgi:hypothetical protein